MNRPLTCIPVHFVLLVDNLGRLYNGYLNEFLDADGYEYDNGKQ